MREEMSEMWVLHAEGESDVAEDVWMWQERRRGGGDEMDVIAEKGFGGVVL